MCVLPAQIRLIDLHKEAIRPYSTHASSVNSILPLSTSVFVSGGADGTVRCHDSRVHGGGSSHGAASTRNTLLGACYQPGCIASPHGLPADMLPPAACVGILTCLCADTGPAAHCRMLSCS